jgi:hypothetical protein
MKRVTSRKLSLLNQLFQSVIPILLILFLLPGCASTSRHEAVKIPQIITLEKGLKVHLYDSIKELQATYMYHNGDAEKIKKVLGFYSESDNTIHCLKWDFYTCGHELYHALQYKGNSPLLVEKGYEHFKEHNYASE